jgi:hypothetical protein
VVSLVISSKWVVVVAGKAVALVEVVMGLRWRCRKPNLAALARLPCAMGGTP